MYSKFDEFLTLAMLKVLKPGNNAKGKVIIVKLLH